MRPPRVARRVARQLPATFRTMLLHQRGDYVPWEEGFDFTPPTPGPGEWVGPPDFVGVGVQKGGTSWWYSLILDHPGVADRPGVPKERHYLSRFLAQPFGDAEVARYHGWFPRTDGTIAGEWTPDYLAYPWVAPLLARAAPDTRVLVMLRDPVDRFRSGLSFRIRQGGAAAGPTVADAVRQGFYAESLRGLYAHFPREQVLVLQYERCRDNPAGELARTFEYLGLDPFVPEDLRREVNVSTGQKVELAIDARRRLAELYAEDLADLAVLEPELDLSLWPHAMSVA